MPSLDLAYDILGVWGFLVVVLFVCLFVLQLNILKQAWTKQFLILYRLKASEFDHPPLSPPFCLH